MAADRPIHAVVRGEGPPLVFLHGAWMSRRMWAAQVAAFSGEYRTVAVDVRGHGRTGRPDGVGLTVDRFARDLRGLLDSLSVERPVLCGLSLGGLIAQAYALRHPDDVRGLFLADTVRTVPPVPFPRTSLGKRLLFPKPALHSMVRAAGPEATFRWLLAGIEATSGRPWLVDAATREYVLGEVARFDRTSFLRVFDALYEHEPRDLRAIDAPTRVVYGDHEPPSVVAQSRGIARRVPGVTLTSIPDAGHVSNRDNPEAFDAALSSFLAEAC